MGRLLDVRSLYRQLKVSQLTGTIVYIVSQIKNNNGPRMVPFGVPEVILEK